MHKRILYAGAAAVTLLAGCQASKPAASASTASPAAGPAVETLGNYPVPANEFAYVYRKNNSSAPDFGTRQSVTDYLDLYTNFRLKVLEAEQKGLDTTQAFKRELDGYRQQLSLPYLTEKSVTDQLVREAYDRMSQEVNASHILIRVAPDATPQDTLAAYKKIEGIRQQALGGADFAQLARTLSEDPSAKENAGKLGYFTAMQMVYPFESAAYKTPVGQVSAPIRTRFGYHIIKVNDKRAAQGEIKVAHLMIRMNANAAKSDSLTAKKKVDELYSRLKKGENWDKLVAQFSEDAGSAANGGELPPFGTGRMIPSFEEVAFKLQKPGDISAPVQTPYGWHIIKLIEKQPVPKFADMEASLKSKVAKDSRSELNKAAFLKRVRQEDKFVEIPAAKTYVFSKADTALVAGRFKYAAPAAGTKAGKGAVNDNSPLFTIMGKPYTVKDFLTYVQQNQRPRTGAQPSFAMQQLYEQYVEQSLTDFEKSSLENKYEDYRMLVKEYRDGILLFQLMDEKVWSKAIEDTVGLKKYFAANQAKYQWDQRVQGTVVSAATPALLARVQKELKAGRFQVTRNVPKTAPFGTGTASPSKAGGNALADIAKRMLQDTLARVTFTGRVKKGEKASLARARADAAAKYLQTQGVPARRISKTVQAAPAAEGSVQIGLVTGNPAAIESEMNEKNPLSVQITQRVFQKGDNKLVDELMAKGPGTYTVQKDGRYNAVTIEKILPAGPKTLAEARGQATSDYQTYLEKEWINELRTARPVKVNEGEVNKLITK
ncbi:peptidyl-prolyl cis-trans isomerase [Hymenobacter sp. BT770]|uniref:peptidylprolyl isomerase n=1 Tax=Hymenobacter sp. BT770 TaxID=2886942 RepID=UPI001D10BB0D|nr:peptidylprolyl isomerase [Hymenobacter sp. BT770]MCC3151833.1 peptidyl-prolyl cis-trans isomerase [Hymenobacter sp. BT770]MDO3413545.1 peptidyl-prolyl cis-trans isomerase [Hymenobacter sp. BT770]